jgi:ABC-type nickel/cobalt efflux system permease component RcnA
MKILAFNVGVEAGQVLALAVMLFALSGWRTHQSFHRFSKVANVSLMLIGALLLLFQLHGYQHSAFADAFPLNKDDHSHAHEELSANPTSTGLVGYTPRGIFAKPLPKKPLPKEAEPAALTRSKRFIHRHGSGPAHGH